jgi:Tfp pilus assembly protein PilO
MKQVWKMRPAEFRLALIAAGLIGCWGLVSGLLQPQWDRLTAQQLSLETHLERRQAFERLFAQAPEVEVQHERVRPFLESARAAGSEAGLLTELEQLSREASVLLNLKPRPMKGEKDTRRYELELDLEGAQDNLLSFLDGFFRLPRLFTIERLRISTVPTRTDVLRANVVIQHITLPAS